MDESLRAQIDTYLSHLDGLIQRGRQIREKLAVDPTNPSTIAATRVWQEDCGVTIHQLSGGSKAHWLAAAFSEAFLVRAPGGNVEDVAPAEIVERLVGVLRQAVDSLQRMSESPAAFPAAQAQPPRRFGFVQNAQIRPVLEQAYVDGQSAFEQGQYAHALITYCSILETLVTDALENKGAAALAHPEAPGGRIADWPFVTRLEVAEKAGVIRGGWVRLPEIARRYRELGELASEAGSETMVSETDAKRTGQVLHVVMRDLNPGR